MGVGHDGDSDDQSPNIDDDDLLFGGSDVDGGKGGDKEEDEPSNDESDRSGTPKGKRSKKKKGRPQGSKNKTNSGGVDIDATDKDPPSGGKDKVKKSRNKIVNGKKYCRPCGKWEALDLFPQGGSACADSRRVIQNLGRAAEAQGLWNWFVDKQNNDESAFQKLVRNYKVRLAAAGSALKMGLYPIAQYYEDVRRERQAMGSAQPTDHRQK